MRVKLMNARMHESVRPNIHHGGYRSLPCTLATLYIFFLCLDVTLETKHRNCEGSLLADTNWSAGKALLWCLRNCLALA